MAAGAITIKFDLHGSAQTKGVTTRRYDRATRRFRATGATNDDQILDQVINEAIRQAGPFHQAATSPQFGNLISDGKDLPLQRVFAKRFGLQVRGRLLYGFDRWSFRQGHNPNDTASFAGGYEATDSYRYPYDADNEPAFSQRGLPNGAIYGADELDLTNKQEGRPQRAHSWTFLRPVVRAEVRTTIHFNPIGEVFPLQGKVNSDQVLFGGYLFDAFTIRFDKPIVRWTSSRFGDAFTVTYVFTIVAGGHFRHFAQWIPDDPNDPDSAGIWDIREGLAYDLTPFVGNFPI